MWLRMAAAFAVTLATLKQHVLNEMGY